MKLRSNMLLFAVAAMIGGFGLSGCSDALLNPADDRAATEVADETAGKVWERLRSTDPIGFGGGDLTDTSDPAPSDSTDTSQSSAPSGGGSK